MRKVIKELSILMFFIFGFSIASVAQITKAEATTFISNHPAKDVQYVLVNYYVGQVDELQKGNSEYLYGDSFQASTTVITALDNCIHIKDGSGKEMYVPYLRITSLFYEPETDERYSSIRIISH